MENESRQRKEFKNKQQEGHITQTNIRNRTDSTTDTERCRTRTRGLGKARAPTQEVRQSLPGQGGSTGSLPAGTDFQESVEGRQHRNRNQKAALLVLDSLPLLGERQAAGRPGTATPPL